MFNTGKVQCNRAGGGTASHAADRSGNNETAGSTAHKTAPQWPAPNPKLKPDPRCWVWISNIPKYVEPKGRWNSAGEWKK